MIKYYYASFLFSHMNECSGRSQGDLATYDSIPLTISRAGLSLILSSPLYLMMTWCWLIDNWRVIGL